MYRTSQDTQLRKDAKKQMILDTAAKVFSQKGYHKSTVKDVTDMASISVGTFYFYFKSKEDLFLTLYQTIVQEFNETTLQVINMNDYDTLKNYTRVMIATLWMYEQKQDIARIMLLEAVTVEPKFKELEDARLKKFTETMAFWFERFQLMKEVNIPDVHTAALIYTGSYYSFINEWLASDRTIPLTNSGYAFCVYHLQALHITFNKTDVKEYIKEVLTELNESKYNKKGE